MEGSKHSANPSKQLPTLFFVRNGEDIAPFKWLVMMESSFGDITEPIAKRGLQTRAPPH